MIPEYVGASAFGIKMGLVVRGSDLIAALMDSLTKIDEDGLLSDGDVACITESVVARAQNNYITTEETALELRKKLELDDSGTVGVLFPITSRNRFSLVLEGIATSVPRGKVIIQLSYPRDEVGNQILPHDVAESLGKKHDGCIFPKDFNSNYRHPLTGVDYTRLYTDIVTKTGAEAKLYLCNDPLKILQFAPDAVIAADIHTRERTKNKIKPHLDNVITLQEVFNSPKIYEAWSEWGLLGSNLASGHKLKLAPRNCSDFVQKLQNEVRDKLNKEIEVIIYGDGAYKDPTSGIYELADPCAAFGATPGLNEVFRTGIKLKYMVDLYQEQGYSEDEIRDIIEKESKKERDLDSDKSEGTTPRPVEDLLASLADLVSGSADAGTPLVLVKGFLQ